MGLRGYGPAGSHSLSGTWAALWEGEVAIGIRIGIRVSNKAILNISIPPVVNIMEDIRRNHQPLQFPFPNSPYRDHRAES